jgi:hypothetical protein
VDGRETSVFSLPAFGASLRLKWPRCFVSVYDEFFDSGTLAHGHAQCFDLVAGEHASWHIGNEAFYNFEGTSLFDFAAAVKYHNETGHGPDNVTDRQERSDLKTRQAASGL